MSEAGERTPLAVVLQLYALTKEMTEKSEDAEFLIEAVDQRQQLMDEVDQLLADGPAVSGEDQAEMKRLVQEVIGMDTAISAALEKHKVTVKGELQKSNNKKKVLGYVNQAMSSSGSYMDYKK